MSFTLDAHTRVFRKLGFRILEYLPHSRPMDTERFADLPITHALLAHSKDGRAKLMFVWVERIARGGRRHGNIKLMYLPS